MENMSVKQLQVELRNRGLTTTGSKRVLLKRIRNHDKETGENGTHRTESRCSNIVNLTIEEVGGRDPETRNVTLSETATVTDEELRNREWEIIRRERELLENERVIFAKEREIVETLRNWESARLTKGTVPNRPTLNCTIRDISDALPNFSPGDISSMSAECWVDHVETLKTIYAWDEKALLMAAGAKMHGPARYWWDTTQQVSTSWNDRKSGLKMNFPHHYSEVEIHQQLMKKIRKPTESIETYCFEMNMVGKRIALSDKTIIQYILTGLNDTQMSMSLAAANFKDIAELIEKIKRFDEIRTNSKVISAPSTSKSVTAYRPPTGDQTNFKSEQLTIQKKPLTCYNCNQTGHYARNCTQTRKRQWLSSSDNNLRTATKTDKTQEKNYRVNIISDKGETDCYYKNVFIHDKQYNALLDSGSEQTIVSKTVAIETNSIIDNCIVILHGFGGGSCQAIGRITCKIQIDGSDFPVRAVVVEDKCLSTSIIIGKDILNNPECDMFKHGGSLTLHKTDMGRSYKPVSAVDIQAENYNLKMDHHLMAFHWDTDVGLFLFSGLDITGVPALIGLCVILVFISIIYEAVKVFQTSSKSKIARERFRSVSSATEATNLLVLERRHSNAHPSAISNSNKFLSIFAQAVVFLFQNVTSYMLMLAVMVYNIYVFVAIVLGMGLGYFLFGHISMKINMENIRARTTNALCNERNRLEVPATNNILSRNHEDNQVASNSTSPISNPNCLSYQNHSANNGTSSNIESDVEIHQCRNAVDTDDRHTCRL